MITITAESERALASLNRELERISQLENPTGQQKRRFEAVQVQIAQLRSGMRPSQIIGSDIDRLESELKGHTGRALPFEAETDWRDFISGTSKRGYQSAGNHEVRSVMLAGTQSISYTEGAQGGYFVPVGYVDRQLSALKQYDEIFDDANHNRIDTVTGAPCTLPAFDDTSNAAVQIGENTKYIAPIITAAVTQLSAYSFRGGLIFVSQETLQDSGIPIGGLLERVFAVRMARGVGQALITGAGGGTAPTGILTALNELDLPEVIAAGANANTGLAGDTGANSIGTDDLQALYFSVNRAYRRTGRWLMSDNTLFKIASLVDKYGGPLVRYNADQEASLYNRSIVVCPSMPDIAANAPSVIFYNPDYFYVRHVARGNYVQMLTQVPGAVEFGNCAFQSFSRWDSALATPNAAYPAGNQLIQHS